MIDIGQGQSVSYVALKLGRWETSDGIAIVVTQGTTADAHNCHLNPRLRTRRQSYQLRSQATLEDVKKVSGRLEIPSHVKKIQCADGMLEL